MNKLRIDKWLWAARFYKTRSLAAQEINKGRIIVNGQTAKPSREVSPGDIVTIRKEDPAIVVTVQAISAIRGPAPKARELYKETREKAAEMQRLAPEPSIDLRMGRPTKRDRRELSRFRGK
jgi:ribosome-associated heat shock protein Hsp15